MVRMLCLLSTVLVLSGCSLRVFAAATTAALDVYTTAYIQSATPAERAELKQELLLIQPFTDQAAAGVRAKIALIESMETPPP